MYVHLLFALFERLTASNFYAISQQKVTVIWSDARQSKSAVDPETMSSTIKLVLIRVFMQQSRLGMKFANNKRGGCAKGTAAAKEREGGYKYFVEHDINMLFYRGRLLRTVVSVWRIARAAFTWAGNRCPQVIRFLVFSDLTEAVDDVCDFHVIRDSAKMLTVYIYHKFVRF